MEVKNRMAKVDVELWDTSGNVRFEKCWPALAREAHGVIFVFHPGMKMCCLKLFKFEFSFMRGPKFISFSGNNPHSF